MFESLDSLELFLDFSFEDTLVVAFLGLLSDLLVDLGLQLLNFFLGLFLALLEDFLETIEFGFVGVLDGLDLLLDAELFLLLVFEEDILFDPEVFDRVLELVEVSVFLGELVSKFVEFDLSVSLLATVSLEFLGDLVVLELILSLELIYLFSELSEVILRLLF